jgi:hypothetical protein
MPNSTMQAHVRRSVYFYGSLPAKHPVGQQGDVERGIAAGGAGVGKDAAQPRANGCDAVRTFCVRNRFRHFEAAVKRKHSRDQDPRRRGIQGVGRTLRSAARAAPVR